MVTRRILRRSPSREQGPQQRTAPSAGLEGGMTVNEDATRGPIQTPRERDQIRQGQLPSAPAVASQRQPAIDRGQGEGQQGTSVPDVPPPAQVTRRPLNPAVPTTAQPRGGHQLPSSITGAIPGMQGASPQAPGHVSTTNPPESFLRGLERNRTPMDSPLRDPFKGQEGGFDPRILQELMGGGFGPSQEPVDLTPSGLFDQDPRKRRR